MPVSNVFMPILKSAEQADGSLMVTGIATDDTLDIDEQICDPAWLKEAMPAWFKYGNIREQHSNIAAGVATKLEQEGNKHIVTAHVVDPSSVAKVKAGVLKGFSIGIRNPRVSSDKDARGGRIVDGQIVEVSLVDRPANPSCAIELAKSVDGEIIQVEELIEKGPGMERCAKCLKAYKSDDLNPHKVCKECQAKMDGDSEESAAEKAAKPMKTEGGEKYPAEAYAYVPDASKPSSWKLRLWDSPSAGVTTAQVGRALAALSEGGFRGNRVEIPSADMAGVKRKIRAAWNQVHEEGDEMPDVLKAAEESAIEKAEESSQEIGEESSQVMGEESSREDGIAGVAGKAAGDETSEESSKEESSEGSDAESSLDEEESEESSTPAVKSKKSASKKDIKRLEKSVLEVKEMLVELQKSMTVAPAEDIADSINTIDERLSQVEKSASRGPVRTAVGAPKAEINEMAVKAAAYRAKAAATNDPALAEGYLLLASDVEKSI